MRLLTASAVVGAVLSAVLLAVRAGGAISLSEPLQVITSGWEQESLAAIWEYLHGSPIYVSRYDIPYRWSIYNWLFYVGYGAVIGAVLDVFSLGDPWLPTVGRLITLLGVAAAFGGAILSYRAVSGSAGPNYRLLALSFAVLVSAGPLVGFWAITTRPDVWALALEIWAVAAFWRLYGRRPVTAVLAFCLLAYGAWAFKQSNVVAIAAVALYLAARREGRPLAVLACVMAAAWGATLALGTPAYLNSIVLSEDMPVLAPGHMAAVAANFAAKFVPGVGGAAAVLIALGRSSRLADAWRENDGLAFSAAGLAFAAVLVAVTSLRAGSAENYYFTLAYFTSLFVLSGLRAVAANPTLTRGALTLGWLAQAGAVAAVLAGAVGVTSVRPTHRHLMDNKACLDTLPSPLFVADIYLSLPWMTPGSPSFVLGYGYERLREAGRPMERGGVGGLIDEGFFAALALPPGTAGAFDASPLGRYAPAATSCAAFRVFLRKPDAPGKID